MRTAVRAVALGLVLAFALLSSGCAVIEKETTNRGGYVDYIADKYWLKADSKGMRALRAFALQVSLAYIASVSAKDDTDRQLLAVQIGALTKKFEPVLNCAFGANGAPRQPPCFYYDSAMVRYSNGLFDLAKAALPQKDVNRLVSEASGSVGNPINVLDLLSSLVEIGQEAFKYGRIVGALYRDTVELDVQVWLGTPAIDNRPAPYRVTELDVAPLRELYESGNDDMQAWVAAMAALRHRGLEPVPQRKFFVQLGGLMRFLCGLITKDPNTLNVCEYGLPRTLPPAKSVLSHGGSVGGALSKRGHGSRTPGNRLMEGGITDPEKRMTKTIGWRIQGNLCVAKTGKFDSATRNAIHEAKLGGNQSSPNARPFTNIKNEIVNSLEADKFYRAKGCSLDPSGVNRGYRTAFEKFAFPSGAAVVSLQVLLEACDSNLTEHNGTFDGPTRTAIKVAKGKLSAARKSGLTDLKTDTLNASSYNAISRTCR